MQAIDLVISPRWILPIIPKNQILEGYSLAVNQGKIVDILPSHEVALRYQPTESLEFPQHVIMPGLVNTHTHTPMTLLRGVADDLPLMTWLQEHIWPLEGKWVSEEFVYDGSILAILEMLTSGTTTFSDMYFYPDQTIRAVKETGIRAAIGLNIMDIPTSWGKDGEDYLQKCLAIYKAHEDTHRVTFLFAPHAPYTVSDPVFTKVKHYATELGLPIHMHLHETQTEIQGSLDQYGMRPLVRLKKLGLIDDQLIAVHMTQLTQDEITILSDAGTSVVHCPESNCKLASGLAPVPALLDAGVNLAFGTDGAASNNDLDMFSEMRTASLLAKLGSSNPTILSAWQTLECATLHGAKALHLDHLIGSLEVGKQADVIAIRLDDPSTSPITTIASHLVYAAGRHQVTDVIIDGKVVVKNRIPTTINTQQIMATAQTWFGKFKENPTS